MMREAEAWVSLDAAGASEVVFMGEAGDDAQEPLLGYVILEQALAAVDMLGHRLVPVKYLK